MVRKNVVKIGANATKLTPPLPLCHSTFDGSTGLIPGDVGKSPCTCLFLFLARARLFLWWFFIIFGRCRRNTGWQMRQYATPGSRTHTYTTHAYATPCRNYMKTQHRMANETIRNTGITEAYIRNTVITRSITWLRQNATP